MLQSSLLLMKSLNKTETPIFFVLQACSLFPKAIFLTFIVKSRTSVLSTPNIRFRF